MLLIQTGNDMKTETLELTKTELDYLWSILSDHIGSGEYWGNKKQFVKMQDNLFEKIEDALRTLDKEHAKHGMD